LGQQIDEGGFSTIYEAYDIQNAKNLVAKVVSKGLSNYQY
jgi:serine/threonine protein kinase